RGRRGHGRPGPARSDGPRHRALPVGAVRAVASVTTAGPTSTPGGPNVTLRDVPTHTTLPCEDLTRARAFYADKLGLQHATESPAGLWYETEGGSRFFLFASRGRPSGSHTQMGFRVSDIAGTVRDLEGRGVEFEMYDFPGFDRETKVATTGPVRSAWFKDSE